MADSTLRGSLEGFAAQLGGGVAGAVARVTDAVPGTSIAGAVIEAVGGEVPGGEPLAALGGQLKRPEQLARRGQVLPGAGVVRGGRPCPLLKGAQALMRWHLPPASPFVVSALRYPDEPPIVD